MADAGNKAGEVFVQIGADMKPAEAAFAELPVKAKAAAEAAQSAVAAVPIMGGSSLKVGNALYADSKARNVAAAAGGTASILGPDTSYIDASINGAVQSATKAEASMGGLLKAATAVKQTLMKLFIPVAVTLGLAKWIDSMVRLREETKHLADAYNKLGNENARSVAKRIRDLNGEADATKDLLEVTNAHSAALRAKYDADISGLQGLEGQYRAFVAGMSVEEMGKKFTEAYASQMRRIPAQFKDLQNATEAKAARDKAAAAKKETDDLIKTEKDRAKQAAEAAVEAENQAKLAGLTGNDAVNEKLRQDTEKLEADRATAMSYQEQQAIDRKLAAIKTIAEAQRAANNAADAERKKAEAEDVARRIKHEQDVARAAQQALTDFNNQARTSLNDLLNSGNIAASLADVVSILQQIKNSQGAV